MGVYDNMQQERGCVSTPNEPKKGEEKKKKKSRTIGVSLEVDCCDKRARILSIFGCSLAAGLGAAFIRAEAGTTVGAGADKAGAGAMAEAELKRTERGMDTGAEETEFDGGACAPRRARSLSTGSCCCCWEGTGSCLGGLESSFFLFKKITRPQTIND